MRWGWISLFFWPTIIIRTLSGNTNLNVEKRYFYHGDKHFMETPEVSNITFVTSFTVDFGLQYYLSTFEFRSTNMKGSVSVALYHESVHQDENIECTDNSVQESFYIFTCTNASRFLQVLSNTTLTMFNIVFKGYAVYSELFIGCYEMTREEKMKNASELVDCISTCKSGQFLFAGVKDGLCLCKNDFIDMNPLEIGACKNSTCRDGIMCGSGVIVPMYFAAIDKLLTYTRIHPNCIQNKSACTKCPYGFSGPKCNNRNCLIDNASCGDGTCTRYNSPVKVSACLCKSGFNPTLQGYCVDVNECSDPKFCGGLSECINTHGSYDCLCSSGFKLNKSKKCSDIDECERASSCNATSSTCVNTWGSYTCKCLTGFEASNSLTCRDIDECIDKGKKPCKEDRICKNTYGSFLCVCLDGYSLNQLLDKCLDINECQLKTDACDSQSTKCQNMEGTYECLCITGFRKNSSYSCTDFDECLDSNLCGLNTQCRNLIGSYDCQCLKGYSEKSAYECIDINECKLGESNCDKTATCKNTLGSYVCHCERGTRLETFEYMSRCIDIDECADVKICKDQFVCINYHKGFTCECRAGFTKVNNSYCKAPFNFSVDYRGESEYKVDEENSSIKSEYILYGIMGILGVLLVLTLITLTCKSIISAGMRKASTHSDDDDF